MIMNKTKTALTIGIIGLGFLSSLHSNQNSAVAYTPSINKAEATMITEHWPDKDVVVWHIPAQKPLKKAFATPSQTAQPPIKYFKSPYQQLKYVDKKAPNKQIAKKRLLVKGDKPISVKKSAKAKPTIQESRIVQKDLTADERTYGFWDKRRHLSDTVRYKIIANAIKLEGGYNPKDSNGYPVKYGVNQEFYRPLPGFPKKVKDLTKAQAHKYYFKYYYNRHWEHAGYKPEYIAFLLDASIQHGYTYTRFERGCKGELKCSIAKRAAYSRDWAIRSGNSHIIAGLTNRVKSFNELKIV